MSDLFQHRTEVVAIIKQSIPIPEESKANFVFEHLRALAPATGAIFVAELCMGSLEKKPGCDQLLVGLAKLGDLSPRLGYDKVAAMYEFAASKHLLGASTLLREVPIDATDGKLPPLHGRLPADAVQEMGTMTLGERREQAKGSEMKKLEMLLEDTDAMVIRNLLNNPRINERQVIKLATRRNLPAATLIELFQHRRWGCQYRIRKALVFNPNTPLKISATLLFLLQKTDISLAAEMKGILPESLYRLAADLLMCLRTGGMESQ